jgi:tRNA(Ile2) C34 agmatinyltransferase TiaS
MIYIGLDDTDVLESRGTGHLAREIARDLKSDYSLLGVTRHQLLVDPRVPCTKNNSCAAIHLNGAATHLDGAPHDLDALFERVKTLMLADFYCGSDPGLCIAEAPPAAITDYGRRAQREIVTQEQARALAAQHGIKLVGLGGDEDGVIGALSAVGLAASGSDGRYVLVGRSRQLGGGLQPISAILAAGIDAVQTIDGQPVTQGLVQTDKLRPARRNKRPILVVEWDGTCWQPLKLD